MKFSRRLIKRIIGVILLLPIIPLVGGLAAISEYGSNSYFLKGFIIGSIVLGGLIVLIGLVILFMWLFGTFED